MKKTRRKHGAIPDQLDLRDFRYELVAGAEPIPEEFSLRDKISKVEDQGKSGSCVSQAFSYYTEVLNTFEADKEIQLSARDIYSLIHLDSGGAYLREGAKQIVKRGIALEEDAPSYMNNKPPTEAFMRQRNDITEEELEIAKNYLAKSYARVEPKFDSLKRAINESHGVVAGLKGNDKGWEDAYISPPVNPDWAHAIYLCGYDKTSIHFVNSWGTDFGNSGFGRFGKEYENYIFNPWTLIDRPNDYYKNLLKKRSLLQKITLLYKQLLELIKRADLS